MCRAGPAICIYTCLCVCVFVCVRLFFGHAATAAATRIAYTQCVYAVYVAYAQFTAAPRFVAVAVVIN